MSYTCREDVRPQKGKQALVMKMIQNQEVDFMLAGGARAGGKALPRNTLVWTSKGLTYLDKIKVGDLVVCPSTGKYAPVVQTHPITQELNCILTFSDGSTQSCSPNHQWAVFEDILSTELKVVNTRDISILLDKGLIPSVPEEDYFKSDNTLARKTIVDLQVDGKLPMLCITVDSIAGLYKINGGLITHNSELLSMMPLLFAHDPQYRGIFFRRSYDEIMGANGLWQKAQNMYPFFGAKPNKTAKSWTFPNGAIQEYRHLFNDGDEESHRGKGYSFVGFDEIDQFTPDMIRMLMTCLRSEAKMASFMVGTLNPHPDSWCLPLVEWYLNEDGSPNEERCGVIRWYIVKDNDFVFGPNEDWFKEHHPESVYVQMPNSTEKTYVRPKRFTYVFFNVFDNPLFCAANPTYISELNNLPDHERATQLFGNWRAREKGESYFKREFLNRAAEVPSGSVCVRSWDKAYSDNLKASPDYTASIKMYKCPKNEYYIVGDYHPEIHDDFDIHEDIVLGRFRKRVGPRDEWMLKQAHYDGFDCTVVIPEEQGAGKGETEQLKKMFIGDGFLVKTCKTGTAAESKLKKFLTFCSAAENGLVHIVESSFSSTATLNTYLKELEQFTGKRSTRLLKDDWVDATSDCYLTLRQHRIIKAYALPDCTGLQTRIAKYRENIQ